MKIFILSGIFICQIYCVSLTPVLTRKLYFGLTVKEPFLCKDQIMVSLPSCKLTFTILETRLCHSSIVTIWQPDIVNQKVVAHLLDIELVSSLHLSYYYLLFFLDNGKLWLQSSSNRSISPKLNKYTLFKSNAYHSSTLLL